MRNLISILTVLFSFIATVNAREISDVLDQREQKRNRYILRATSLDAVVINMPFGQSTIISTANRNRLKGATIYQIDLVYTDFPKGVDLTELNRQRILKTLELRSDLIKDESIVWKMIRQMDCKSEAEAQTLFHGVVIHFRPIQDETLSLKEKDFYNEVLPKNGETISNTVFKQFRDSSVVAAFRRNKWKEVTVVTDVTCSMSPYVAQFALWYYLNFNGKSQCNVVLFNDGDGKRNAQKTIGSTGGLYTDKMVDYSHFVKLLMDATSKGCSGDVEENGIEAILEAQEHFPHAKEIIFIADNFANLRDISLLDQVRIPVRVVVCGAGLAVNIELLNIAYKTKGSIHTIEKDLKDFPNYKEGQVVMIGSENYKIDQGKFRRL